MTSTKCPSLISHVQIQCTITLVSDAQTEGKVSGTPKSWLPCNNGKTYYNTFATSAVLAYCQPSQEAPIIWRIYVTNQLVDYFMYFLEYWLKVFFLGILPIQCKIDQLTLGNRPVDRNLLATPALCYCQHHVYILLQMLVLTVYLGGISVHVYCIMLIRDRLMRHFWGRYWYIGHSWTDNQHFQNF